MVGKDPTKFIEKLIKNISGIFLLPIPEHQYIQPYEIKSEIMKTFNTKIFIECSLNVKEALKIIRKKLFIR